MKKIVGGVLLSGLCLLTPASAEPSGRWYAGFGQGILEYGYTVNDQNGVQIYCDVGGTLDGAVGFSPLINGDGPPKGSKVEIRIGDEDYEFYADAKGDLRTDSRVAADNFIALWSGLRDGRHMRVSFTDGRRLAIPLIGSAKVLPKSPCTPTFYK